MQKMSRGANDFEKPQIRNIKIALLIVERRMYGILWQRSTIAL